MYLSRFDGYGVADYREGTEPMYSSGVIGVINSIPSMFFHDRLFNKRHTTVATSGIGTAHPSGEHMFALGI